MSLKDDLKAQAQGKTSVEQMMLKNKLERLFYIQKEKEQRYGLHASAVLGCLKDGFCYREQVLSLFFQMNQGEQLPIKLLKIFAQGNAMHEKWYALFRQAGIDVAIERTLFIPEYDLSFTIDALIDFNKPYEDRESKPYICDVKSQNTMVFRKSKGHPSGEAQVNFYLWALTYWSKNRDGKKYENGFVLVDSKDDQEIKAIPVHYDKKKVEPVIDCLKEIKEMKKVFVKEHEAPKRICKNADCKRAKECNMRDACWNIGMGRIKLPKELRESRLENG